MSAQTQELFLFISLCHILIELLAEKSKASNFLFQLTNNFSFSMQTVFQYLVLHWDIFFFFEH